MTQERALIVGVGDGLSASLARLFHKEGMELALASRNTEKFAGLAAETGASVHTCDAGDRDSVASMFDALDSDGFVPDVVIYNPSFRVRGPVAELDQEAVEKTLMISAYGAFLVAQHAAKRMLTAGSGSILFTGASAGVKGYANSAPFAMGKFALRGLAQSMARELHPQNIHIGHFVIDGGIGESADDSKLHPDAIADSYLHFHRQHRSSWAWEIELRPFVENF
ncbi:MAG: SDR family oxidoreductase [Rhodospirillaceae bacterium]|jgi:NAD(P)-dependent dehydrogenase (short-subunit alcohol dehydrogenase family)|nr:SDR family oxidoreductase [Rhodospirillaceae bacterium]MBT6205600.1 SDR family oxidoreductase [Rhodospirillaceae bacterium]MBT6509728.1 SDR family oxidoreductase [Rhodospirillaceae bacterium]MBT7614244.1 SDR family oxidoreductase [Rhodospirillaceae bacterium]MBT7647572.1 SDR family oxidoreductase [Rhodospirillaceae bacterium]